MKRLTAYLLFLFLVISLSFSQNQNLTILCVAAHPDDEDGATLAFFSKLYGYNAYTVFYTRGEGGQNEIGPELNDALGRIREQECYNAAAIQGSHAYFLGCLDFGFSKTAKETFKLWGGEDSVLQRIVYMIRVIKPEVVITNHDTITTKPNRQHGNHQAVGITIYEAFDKAADPNYHTEQFHDGITPWQIKKLYFRVYDTTKTNVFTLDISQKDVSGKSIEDISWNALSQHKTQGMDKLDRNTLGVSGNRKYELVRSDKMYPIEGDDLFAGLVQENKGKINLSFKSYTTYYNYRDTFSVNPLDYKFNHWTKIGLVKTYDNSIEDFFKKFEIEYTLLDSLEIAQNTMEFYDVILLDLRAYLYRNNVLQYNSKLLGYVKNGGNIVCFYNKPQDWNGKGELAPYPIYITSERVTEEDAKVSILYEQHKYFHVPNEMNQYDWDDWVQERNIYLPSDDTLKTSAEYIRLLAMNDENDPVPSTSLLWAIYGKGTYTYCSLALYRQLRILNPGAVKLFLNLLSQEAERKIKFDYKPKK